MLASPIISVIYQHGRFTAEMTRQTAGALQFYAVGLVSYAVLKVLTPAFYALGKKKPPYLDLESLIKPVYEAFGPERLMWATDCPFQVEKEHTYRDSVDLIEKHADFLTADGRRHLLHDTAQRVFFS